MKKAKYRISEAAIKDLDGIWVYTYLNWSKEQADRYHSVIMNEIEFISESSTSGKSMEHVKEGVFGSIRKISYDILQKK